MSKFVVDASVAIKWVLPEIHSDAAMLLLHDDRDLLVPDFFFPEIGNILWKRVRRGEATLENAIDDFRRLMAIDLHIQPSLSLMPQALEIAVRIEQAVYDCVYLALAVSNDCQMVTADQRFYNALRGDTLAPHICWVEDLS